MKRSLTGNLVIMMAIPISLFILLVSASTLLPRNLATVIIFWFILVPVVAVYIPAFFLKGKYPILIGLTGTLTFYALMFFMTYNLYETDLFKIMRLSLYVNCIWMAIILLLPKTNLLSSQYK